MAGEGGGEGGVVRRIGSESEREAVVTYLMLSCESVS